MGGTKDKVKPVCKPRSKFSRRCCQGLETDGPKNGTTEGGAQGDLSSIWGSHETTARKVFRELKTESKHSVDDESPRAELGQSVLVFAASLFRQRPCEAARRELPAFLRRLTSMNWLTRSLGIFIGPQLHWQEKV